MGVSDNQLIRLPGWPAGANNVTREDVVKRDALRQMVNVDLCPDGKVRRRTGYQQRSAIAHTSLHAAASLRQLVAVRGGALGVYDAALTWSERVTAVGACSFEDVHDGVVWTDGERIGALRGSALQSEPLWLACPPPPALVATAVGALPAGEYQIALTWLDASGRESGASLTTLVTVPAGGGVTVGLPSTGAGVTRTRVYASGANGDVLQATGEAPAGAATMTLGAWRGKDLETQHLAPLPPGRIVRRLNGRLYVAAGRALYWSQPLAYGLMHPDNYALFDGEITMLAASADGPDAGWFLGTPERTYFIRGADPKQWTLSNARSHGVVRDSAILVPGGLFGQAERNLPYWLSTDGAFCLGTPDGRVTTVSADRFLAPADGVRAPTMLREENGIQQFITSLFAGGANRAHAVDSAVATIRRHGVEM